MDALNVIFDKETLSKALKTANGINEYYSKSERIVNLNAEKRPKLNFLFYMFPYLFKGDFPGIDNEKEEILCQSAVLCFENIMFFDNFLDSEFNFSEDNINNMFEKYLFNQYQMRLLCRLFDERSEFWGYYEKYLKQYFEALRLERRRYGVFKEYGYEEYKKITRGIYSLWKFQIAALGCLSGNTGIIKKYEEVLDLEATASQLFDDLKDWKDDFKEKRFSWLISRIMNDHGFTPETDISVISEALFKYNYDSMVLGKINSLCEAIMLKSGNVGEYIRKIRMFQYKLDKLNKDLCALKGINGFDPAEIHEHNDNIARYGIENFVQISIDLILMQRANNYPELVHWVVLPKSRGFSHGEDFAGGYVFQRAFILNLMIEMKKMGYLIEDSVLCNELEFLIDHWEEEKAGWSYFHGMHESLPDIDILAEFIILSLEYRDSRLKEYVERAIKNAFRCKGESTLFPKWIVSNENSDINKNDSYFSLDDIGNEFECSEESFADRVLDMWENPYDPASNARIVYALSLYESSNYSSILKDLISCVEKEQNELGAWKSDWYLNNHYTAYLMSKVFRMMGAKDEHVIRLVEFAKGALNGEQNGTVLDSAFAALIVLELDYLSKPESIITIIEESMKRILKSVGEENYWNGVDFLGLKLEDEEDTTNTRIYKSSIFTTSICVYAIAKIQSFLKTHPSIGGQKC